MDLTGQILSGLFGIAIVILIAPRILAVNQGKMLRNITLWVAIFLGLAIVYKQFGPFGSAIEQTAAVQENQQQTTPDAADQDSNEPDPQTQINEENGFSPPQGD